MSESELAANLVDAAIVAGTIDRENRAASVRDGHTHEIACLNCGAVLTGPFCHECGQAAHVHRTLGAFFHDLLHGVLHFEGRTWHTLPLLVFDPGKLTRRYIDGQRARYVSPLALFLFSVFLMFAAIQQTSHSTAVKVRGPDGKPMESRAAVERQLSQLVNLRRTLAARHADTEDVDAEIAGLRPVEAALASDPTDKGNPADKPISVHIALIDALIAKVRENPSLVAYKVEMHAYKYSWLLIPISAPFVWLLFPFNRRFALYDHTVFVTYSLSFMTLLSIVMIIADALGLDSLESLLALVPPLHMYRQLRGAYGCSRVGALVRTGVLLVFAVFALLIFVGLIVAQSMD